MFCVVLFHCTHNVVFFFLSKRKINFKHLIASCVDMRANLVWANSPWGETGSYPTKYTNTLISMKSIIKYNLQTQFVVLVV